MRTSIAAAVVAALASGAGAAVVYVPNGSTLWEHLSPPNSLGVPIDVNQDGVVDLGFYHHTSGGIPPGYLQISWSDDATGGSGYSQAQLAPGALVGPGLAFTTSGRALGSYVQNYFLEPPHYEYNGSLSIPQGYSYWGMKFIGPGGAASYGWLQFYGFNDVTQLGGGTVTVQIVDYAYETQAGVPIAVGAVPAPAGIAMFAVLGLASPRRRR